MDYQKTKTFINIIQYSLYGGVVMGIFKAYDIRGIYKKELREVHAYLIGRAFVEILKFKKVVVGRDIRLSSESLHKELVRGLLDAGAEVTDIGLCSTPMFYFAVAHYRFQGGIMVTASHDPKEYNGFKLCREKAIPISYETGIGKVEKYVMLNDSPLNLDEDEKRPSRKTIKKYILKDYIEHLHKFSINMPTLKIVVDSGNGMGSIITEKLFKKVKCRLIHINKELDGNFPGRDPNPLKPSALDPLKTRVIKERADLGVAFDGDADRAIFVDEEGNQIGADMIIALIAHYLLEKHGKGKKIIYDLRASRAVAEEIKEHGGIALMSRVGHSYITQKMRKEDAWLAGELSGHYYFRNNYYSDSGIIALLKVAGLVYKKNKKISSLIKPLQRYCSSKEINFKVMDKDKVISRLTSGYKAYKQLKLDGLTVLDKEWWFNIRKSNTEPLIRLRVEANTKKRLDELKRKLKQEIEHV